MLYHLFAWEAGVAVERVAYYAVYAFFIISGFSLYISYCDRLESAAQIRHFMVKRFKRIVPLFYTVLLLHLVLKGYAPQDWKSLPANLTLMFGVMNPGETSILAGGWSIGVEMVFYLVFPVAVLCCERSLLRLAILFCIAFAMQLLFVNHVMRGHDTMANGAWVAYTQPVAFGGYFFAGCLLGELYKRFSHLKGAPWAVPAALAFLAVFAVVRVDVPTALLKGPIGLMLAATTIAFIAATAFIREPTGTLRTVAGWFGALSYPVYLLHPLVQHKLTGLPFPAGIRIGLIVFLTIGLSWLVTRYIERRI